MTSHYFIGIDVGSASARAGVFDANGQLIAAAKQAIAVFHAEEQRVEQSGNDIWRAVCHCVRSALQQAQITPQQVGGLSYDATCSLVVVDENGAPLAVSRDGDAERNIIMWMDHRAIAQADAITATQHDVLRYVGEKISPEMEVPKLLWLKTHHPETFQRAAHFFDLTDYLTWRSTGDLTRSQCTVTCKWNYLAHEDRWDADYFNAVGLAEFPQENFARIGQRIAAPGTPCRGGLSAAAAAEMGLLSGTPVAIGMIDAHAGGVGTLGVENSPDNTLAYVFGTSSCTMTSTRNAAFVPGVWGPYFSAMVPGFWLNEGGQSAAGAAIDRLIELHPAAAEAQQLAQADNLPLPVFLANLARQQTNDVLELARDLHIVPEFNGNRAPHADPHARALIYGLGMERDLASLVSQYIAGICSLGYGLRQIIDAQRQNGVQTQSIVISGGAGQHPLVRQLMADSCDLPVLSTTCAEPVLLGAAMLAAVAAQHYPALTDAMRAMTTLEQRYQPNDADRVRHQQRYHAFVLLQQSAKTVRESCR